MYTKVRGLGLTSDACFISVRVYKQRENGKMVNEYAGSGLVQDLFQQDNWRRGGLEEVKQCPGGPCVTPSDIWIILAS